ncbi:MAG: hypothetical protein WAT41_00040 [Flavobacteriales bacterium]
MAPDPGPFAPPVMDGTEIRPLTAIKIDPDTCRVELIQVEPGEVAHVLRAAVTETIDFEEGNCLVLDDGNSSTEHPSRFHFVDDVLQRPYFGTALILGSENSNWTSTTLDVEDIRGRVVWEQWDRKSEEYEAPVLEKAIA